MKTEQNNVSYNRSVENVLNEWRIVENYDVVHYSGDMSSLPVCNARPGNLHHSSRPLRKDELIIESGVVTGIIYYGKTFPLAPTTLSTGSPYIYRYPGGEDVLVDITSLQKL